MHSAGIVLLRQRSGSVELMLVHPGGPFWAKKDQHAWSIPKGEFDPDDEESLVAAKREFEEETGHCAPAVQYVDLGRFKAGNKQIHVWLGVADLDAESVTSNHFEMEWPPKSGQIQSFPEVDKAAWFALADATTKLHKGQAPVAELVSDWLTSQRLNDSAWHLDR